MMSGTLRAIPALRGRVPQTVMVEELRARAPAAGVMTLHIVEDVKHVANWGTAASASDRDIIAAPARLPSLACKRAGTAQS
jgi:hypothetical protein